MRKIFLFIGLFLLLATSVFASEKDYQKFWCDAMNGETEVVLKDETRVDCVTKEYAVEVEFAHKWAESVGQSLYYAIRLNKKPGILLIMGDNDVRFLTRLKYVAKKYKIKIWTIELWVVEKIEKKM